MTTLIIGSTGQVGFELMRAMAPLGPLVGAGRSARVDAKADLTDAEGLRALVRAVEPTVIINAAAYTDVDGAEGDRSTAELVNAEAPGVLAREAAKSGALLVHYSTDYVFDGSGSSPRSEESPTGPLNVYGQTKLAGEQNIADAACRHLIFRTSWVYSARGRNFLRTMARLLQERESLDVVADQIGAPTSASLIADVTAHVVLAASRDKSLRGTYNLVAAGEASWHGFAQAIATELHECGDKPAMRADLVAPVTSDAWPTPATRPLNSRLDTTKLCSAVGLQLPNWQAEVKRVVRQTYEAESSK